MCSLMTVLFIIESWICYRGITCEILCEVLSLSHPPNTLFKDGKKIIYITTRYLVEHNKNRVLPTSLQVSTSNWCFGTATIEVHGKVELVIGFCNLTFKLIALIVDIKISWSRALIYVNDICHWSIWFWPQLDEYDSRKKLVSRNYLARTCFSLWIVN